MRRRAALTGGAGLLVVGLIPYDISPRVAVILSGVALALGVAGIAFVTRGHRYMRDWFGARNREAVSALSDEDLLTEAVGWIHDNPALPMETRATLLRLLADLRDSEAPDRTAQLRGFVSRIRGETTPVGRLLILDLGPALAAVGFIAFWAALFMLIWGVDASSFGGLDARASVGSFVYLAINGALANVPSDLPANSQVAHMAIATEFVLGALLLSTFASVLVRSMRDP